jgi:hypothetical protein
LDPLLSYFPNLEKPTINRIDTYHSPSDSGDLAFMHLLPKDVKIYDGPDDDDDSDLSHWFRYDLEIEESFDPEKLHQYRTRRMAKKEDEELSPLPEIDYQIITTRLIKERLQTLLCLEAAKPAKRSVGRKRRNSRMQDIVLLILLEQVVITCDQGYATDTRRIH